MVEIDLPDPTELEKMTRKQRARSLLTEILNVLDVKPLDGDTTGALVNLIELHLIMQADLTIQGKYGEGGHTL